MAVDTKVIENRNFGVVPFAGGLDLRESKALVRPGTLASCLNYEVTGRGYSRGQGLFLYGGTYDSAVESMWWIAETEANSTLVGSGFTLGGEVTWEGGSGTCVYWNTDGLNSTRNLGVVDVVGESPTTATAFTDTDTSTVFTLTGARVAQELLSATYAHNGSAVAGTVTDYLTFMNSVNTALCASSSSTWPYYKPRIPGTGASTGGFQFRDSVYAARDYMGVGFEGGANEPIFDDTITIDGFTGTVSHYRLTSGNWESGDAAGVLYFIPSSVGSNSSATFSAEVDNGDTITNTTQGNTVGTVLSSGNKNAGFLWKASRQGWSLIDLGYSVKYNNGDVAFPAQVAPLFLDPANVDYIDSGYYTVTSGTAIGDTGIYAAWSNVANITADDGANATATLSPGQKSQILQGNPISFVNSERAQMVGIQVKVQASQSAGTDVRINSIKLVNNATGATEYLSDNQTDLSTLTSTPTDYEFGGQINLWGYESIDPEDLQNQDISVQVQFENTGASSRTVSVDAIWMRVHFTGKGTRVYFWDGTTNVANATIYSYDLHDGSFDTNDAEGYITLHDVVNPEAIVPGLEIYRNTTGSGTPYATTAGSAKRNVLPSEEELAAQNSKWVAQDGNFYENDDGEAVYTCTGASPAFFLDINDKFAFIRTPVAPDKDKPRHVEIHANHLALGLQSGHVLTSVISSPNDFDTANGASAHPYRDKVTGLASVAGNALGVMCQDSINLLVGTQDASITGANDPFRVQNVTPKTGAIEYTIADVFGPMYADYQGVTTISTSDKFGDFEPGRLTAAIEPFTRDRLQRRPATELSSKRPVLAAPFRAKSQYRLYFGDGYFLTLYVGNPQQPAEPCLGHYDPENLTDTYVPTWINSSILSAGRERVVMGTADGSVWIVDGANGIQDDSGLTEIGCHIELNPINTGYPQGAHKTYHFTVLGDFYTAETITASYGRDYLPVDQTSSRTKVVGDYSNAPILNPLTDYVTYYVTELSDAFSIRFDTTMDGSKPHTLHTGIHRYSRKGSARNNTQIPR